MIAHEQRIGIDISTDQLSMMAKLVQRAVENSLKALFETNILLARNVIESDKPINSYEIDIDNSTYGLLCVRYSRTCCASSSHFKKLTPCLSVSATMR
ncbi:MAG: hypothetical protein JW768_15165 [Chitinispirillaceae bacterium]|nr:hypothetical protein [Chitinispirillaceae bacterium]